MAAPRPQRLHVDVLLAERTTNSPNGTVNLLGAGWSTIQRSGPLVGPMSVVAFLKVPYELCNRDVRVELSLVDEDGHVVVAGEQELRITQVARFSPPPGAPNGTGATGSVSIELSPGIPLTDGRGYQWRVAVNSQHEPEWQAAFWVAAAPQPPQLGSGPTALPQLPFGPNA